jgi:hypothetical protein
MAEKAVTTLKELQRAKADMARNSAIYPAFAEIAHLALECRHLEVPEFTDVTVATANTIAVFGYNCGSRVSR